MLRFAYYDSGHEQVDEQITREVVRHMRQSGDWDANWAKAAVSPDLRYDQYNFSSHLYATFLFYRLTKLLPGTADWRGQREGFVVYRFFVALLACIALAQTLWLGWRAGGAIVGLGAALLAALAPQLVQEAHYVRPEPFVAVLTLAAIMLCWPRDALRARRLMAAAFCVGLLIACKVSMLLLVWMPFAPLLAAERKTPVRWPLAAGVALAILAGFALGAPGAWLNPAGFWNGVQFLGRQYTQVHPPHSHYEAAPVADLLGRYFAATLGWPALAAFALGVASLLRERRWLIAALLVAPIALFAGYFATRTVFFERNLSHVLPLFFVVAAIGVARVVNLANARFGSPRGLLAPACYALLAVRPAPISHALIFEEYPGRGNARHDRFEAEVRARHRSAEWHGELYFVPGDVPLDELAAKLRGDRRAVLVRITDYRDERSARHVQTLHARFVAQPAGENHGSFPALPTCTLLAYHRPSYRYFLVTDVRDGGEITPRRRSARGSRTS